MSTKEAKPKKAKKEKAPPKPKEPGYRDELHEANTVIRSMFMDSGAHGLYNRHAKAKGVDGYNLRSSPELLAKRYHYYTTKEFYAYVDQYAAFVKENADSIDFYVNVDAIFHPELSYKVLKYLEKEHGLEPIPVLHYNTPLKWVERHINEGYKFIGLGGLGQDATRDDYARWADRVYDLLCSTPDRKPVIKTHGFAMTSWTLLVRYPWWSVDSASWVKSSAYGVIYVPHMRGGKFTYDVQPYSIAVSAQASSVKDGGKHISKLSRAEQAVIHQWLDHCKVPMGKADKEGNELEWGITSHWGARARANLLYYDGLARSLPEWPWAFHRRPRQGLFI